MTMQIKWALAVVAFVVTAAVARRVGQFEMKDQAEKQIAVLQQQIAKLNEQNTYFGQELQKDARRAAKDAESNLRGEEPISYSKGFTDAVHEYQACKRGSLDDCNHIMMLVVGGNTKFDFLYNEQGNYKTNAFELFERMGGKL